MTGFSGCVSVNAGACALPGETLQSFVVAMVKRFDPEPSCIVESWNDDHAGFSSVSLDADDGIAAEGGVVAAVAGEIAEAEALWAALPAGYRGAAQPPLPEILRLRYLAFGVDGLCGLNGMYAAALWDGRERILHLVTDRRGFRPLFYWQSGDRLFFGLRYSAFTGHPDFPRTLYPPAIHELLRFGYLLGDDTCFEAVKLAPGGSALTWREGKLSVRRYWDYSFQGDVIDIAEAAAGLADRLRTAVERRSQGAHCLQLTGGLDSRAIAGFLHEVAPDARCEAITIGMPTSLEVVYAGKLARDLGYRHTPFYIDSSYLEDMAEEGVRRTEGLVIDHTCWRLATDAWLAANGFNRVSNGFMSIFPRLAPTVKPLLENPGRSQTLSLTHRMLGDMAKEFTMAEVFEPAVYADIADLPDRRIADILAEAPTDRDIHRYDYAELHLRQRGFQAPNMSYFRPRARVFAPITDNDVVDFAGRMAPEVRADSAAYYQMLRTRLPRTCRAPHIKDNLPLTASPLERTLRKAWGRMYYKILPRLTGGAVGTADRMAYVPYRETVRNGSRAQIDADLVHLDRFAGILDVAAARRIAGEYLDGSRPGYGPIYTIHTLCLWSRLFGDG